MNSATPTGAAPVATPVVSGKPPILVLSPHLDDAVLGCSQLLLQHPGSVVATVFTADPGVSVDLTAWDHGCGFSSSKAAMRTRRNEDCNALSVLGARPLHLGFFDSQYAALPLASDITAALLTVLSGAYADFDVPVETVCIPLGLFHCDHIRVFEACLALMVQQPSIQWLAYEDVLYRRRPEVMKQRLAELARHGIHANPVSLGKPARSEAKQRALAAYASQLGMLGLGASAPEKFAIDDVESAEGYWALKGH